MSSPGEGIVKGRFTTDLVGGGVVKSQSLATIPEVGVLYYRFLQLYGLLRPEGGDLHQPRQARHGERKGEIQRGLERGV
jgi:hypothetical protein